ncbi:hypothetical protein BDV06DRAFT_202159 [Aspergillus oleicola]
MTISVDRTQDQPSRLSEMTGVKRVLLIGGGLFHGYRHHLHDLPGHRDLDESSKLDLQYCRLPE